MKQVTQKQIDKLKDVYKSNREDLNSLKDYIDKYGMTDDGLFNANESFEQGWNNAMEFVFTTLGIE